MPLLLSLLFGFAPMFLFAGLVYWLDRYEKEPALLLGAVFGWGAVIAAGAAFVVNTLLGMGVYLFTNSERFTELTTGSLIAPVVEELLKGFAVLVVFLIFRSEFDSLLDGMIYAGIVALGFAATENTYYIYNYGYLEDGYSGLFGLVIIRVILVGWQHPFYTAFTGLGLAVTRLSRRAWLQILAPLTGLGLAIFTHSAHNTLAEVLSGPAGLAITTGLDWTGWGFMLLMALLIVWTEGRMIRRHLAEEVTLGVLSLAQQRTAANTVSQMIARTNAMFSGRYHSTGRFYQLCAELAHKKEQYLRKGDETGNLASIQRLRAEIARLAADSLA